MQLASWKAYLGSRGFHLSDNPRTARHLSKPLTYPMTIAQFVLAATQYPLTEDGAAAFAGAREREQAGASANERMGPRSHPSTRAFLPCLPAPSSPACPLPVVFIR